MNERINEKINEIEKYLQILSEIAPESLDEYTLNSEKKLACERCFEIIIEASTDIAYFIFKEELNKNKNLVIPKDEAGIFERLMDLKIISPTLTKKLIEAKSMRNRLAHRYGGIDNKIVFNSISNELQKDINEFIEEVNKYNG